MKEMFPRLHIPQSRNEPIKPLSWNINTHFPTELSAFTIGCYNMDVTEKQVIWKLHRDLKLHGMHICVFNFMKHLPGDYYLNKMGEMRIKLQGKSN